MKPKSVLTSILLLFVLASVGYLVIKETGDKTPENPGPDIPLGEVADSGSKTIVYYFHATKRCKTCLTIESYAEEALRSGFPEALDSGEMEWRTVNLDIPENEHFVYDYQLASRTVVLVDTEDGVEKKWERLDRVWELVHDKNEFVGYIQQETSDFLADKNG